MLIEKALLDKRITQDRQAHSVIADFLRTLAPRLVLEQKCERYLQWSRNLTRRVAGHFENEKARMRILEVIWTEEEIKLLKKKAAKNSAAD